MQIQKIILRIVGVVYFLSIIPAIFMASLSTMHFSGRGGGYSFIDYAWYYANWFWIVVLIAAASGCMREARIVTDNGSTRGILFVSLPLVYLLIHYILNLQLS